MDLDPTPPTDPVFSTSLNLDGEPLNWVAGDNFWYMFTEFSSDNSGLQTLTGRLAKDNNCQVNCDKSLTFSIRADQIYNNNDFQIEQALFTDDFNYFQNNPSTQSGWKYSFEGGFFDTVFNSTPSSFDWSINGQVIQQGASSFEYIAIDSHNRSSTNLSPNTFVLNVKYSSSSVLI